MSIFLGILFFIYAFREILFWVSLWQLKEYRLDRMMVHLTDTQQGRRTFFSVETGALSLGIFLYALIFVQEQFLTLYIDAVFLFFLYEFLITLQRVFLRNLKRPVITIKSMMIAGLATMTVFSLLLFPLTDYALWVVFLGILLPVIVALTVFLFAFPTEIYTDLYLLKVRNYREKQKRLIVIAVSGSYGKSSTKEIIAHLLGQKFSVAKTPLSQNTPLGVAKSFMKQVNSTTEFFIAELGAYKKGEIEQLAGIVKPTISVTTAVSDQHLALYGGMKNVVASELELIHAIPKKSFVLFNANSEHMELLSEQTSRQIYWYKSTAKPTKQKNTIFAYNVRASITGVSFDIVYNKKSFSFTSPLLGVHTVENILPAIFLAFHFGLSEKEIAEGLLSLQPLPKTMQKKELIPGVTIIDDTFNASPESVLAANAYLQLFPKRKIIVMSPLIELGYMAKMRHRELGKALANVDIIVITNKNYLSELQAGIAEKNGKAVIIYDSYPLLAKYLKEHLKKNDAVVFEGKEAGIVLSQL